jgi:hypothetical protein
MGMATLISTCFPLAGAHANDKLRISTHIGICASDEQLPRQETFLH